MASRRFLFATRYSLFAIRPRPMSATLLLVQTLNGLQFGIILFLIAAGLTLVFGVMDFINLAHGVQYMVGAYFAAAFVAWTGSFAAGLALALPAALAFGLLLEVVVFGFGAMLAGFAGAMVAPILSVEPGMGDNILILAFVVIVIGGIGSIRGAFIAALLIGLVDTVGRTFAPNLLRLLLDPSTASQTGRAIAPMLIYILMAAVLFFRPTGLFPVKR